MKKLLFALLLSISSTWVLSQTTSNLTINYAPDNIALRIDNTDVIILNGKEQPYMLELSEGTHIVEAWKEGFEIQEYTQEVVVGQKNILNIGLNTLTPAYRSYLDEYEKYSISKMQKTAFIGGNVLLFGTATTLLYNGNNKNSKWQQNLQTAKENYAKAFNQEELSLAEQAHDKAIANIKNSRVVGGILAGLAVGTTVWTYLYIKRKNESKPILPEYQEDNPFSFYPDFEEENYHLKWNGAGLTFHF